jgi:hypothetical protein
MSKTRQDIQFKVVAILTGGEVGQPVSPEDADAINGYIDAEVAELSADGTIYIGDPDALDDGLFMAFCKLVANAAADEFGGQSNEQLAAMLRNRVRVIARKTPGYGPAVTEYF